MLAVTENTLLGARGRTRLGVETIRLLSSAAMSSSLLHPGRNLPRRCVLSSQQNVSFRMILITEIKNQLLFVFFKRFKHQNAHRTIPVKLLQDIPGVGEKCISYEFKPLAFSSNFEKVSIQPVAPGRMRHVFYPSKQAAYITERPRKDTSVCS